jgi:hypothetical protein
VDNVLLIDTLTLTFLVDKSISLSTRITILILTAAMSYHVTDVSDRGKKRTEENREFTSPSSVHSLFLSLEKREENKIHEFHSIPVKPLEDMMKNNYVIFHREPNILSAGVDIEFSFIKIDTDFSRIVSF